VVSCTTQPSIAELTPDRKGVSQAYTFVRAILTLQTAITLAPVLQGTAVIGGQLLAMRISQRTVAISGGVMFLLFAANSMLTSAE
jgi:putative Ca2+/H+ antiporter (TMEM165/GDT1 family)